MIDSQSAATVAAHLGSAATRRRFQSADTSAHSKLAQSTLNNPKSPLLTPIQPFFGKNIFYFYAPQSDGCDAAQPYHIIRVNSCNSRKNIPSKIQPSPIQSKPLQPSKGPLPPGGVFQGENGGWKMAESNRSQSKIKPIKPIKPIFNLS